MGGRLPEYRRGGRRRSCHTVKLLSQQPVLIPRPSFACSPALYAPAALPPRLERVDIHPVAHALPRAASDRRCVSATRGVCPRRCAWLRGELCRILLLRLACAYARRLNFNLCAVYRSEQIDAFPTVSQQGRILLFQGGKYGNARRILGRLLIRSAERCEVFNETVAPCPAP